MYDSKLFFLLSTLKQQPREILEFEKFVNSPYFNPKKEVTSLLHYFKKYWNASENRQQSKLTKQAAFKIVFPKEQTFIPWKINECVSDLSLLLEEFITIQELKKRKAQKAILLTEGLKKRGIDKYFFRKVAAIDNDFKKLEQENKARDADFFRRQMLLQESLYYHPNYDISAPINDELLITIDKKLDNYYIIKKLKFACEVYTRHRIYGQIYTPDLLEEVLLHATMNNKDPVVAAYLKIIHLFKTKDVEAVPIIKEQIFDLVKNNDLEYNLDILFKFFNSIPPIANRIQLYFEIYKLAIKLNLLIENGFINPNNFMNVIQLGCALKKYEWITNFKNDYIHFLELKEDTLENVSQLFEGYINFYQGNYRETFILLDKIKLWDMSYGVRRYVLLLRTIIEGKESIGFKFNYDTYTSNFRAYILRKHKAKELSTTSKKGCLIFIFLVNKIYYWEFKKSKKSILYKKLDNNYEIPFRSWLNQKIDVL